MKHLSMLIAMAIHAGGAQAQGTAAPAALKAGEQVYKETCAVCHATGVAKAPKFGDKKDWGPLIKEPQAVLTADGWLGVRGMPARGGKPDLGLEEFARAVAFMARAGGANWKDPDAAMMKQIQAEEKKALDKRAKEAKGKK